MTDYDLLDDLKKEIQKVIFHKTNIQSNSYITVHMKPGVMLSDFDKNRIRDYIIPLIMRQVLDPIAYDIRIEYNMG